MTDRRYLPSLLAETVNRETDFFAAWAVFDEGAWDGLVVLAGEEDETGPEGYYGDFSALAEQRAGESSESMSAAGVGVDEAMRLSDSPRRGFQIQGIVMNCIYCLKICIKIR